MLTMEYHTLFRKVYLICVYLLAMFFN